MTSEICIVGGGPAGLSAALALTQAGHEVTVVDCAVPPIDKACGEGLMPDSLAALARLGVAVDDLGTVMRGIRFFGRDSQMTSANFPNGLGRGVRRVLLHARLVEKAEQIGIRMLWGVKGVQTKAGCVSFRGGDIRTKLIVGADGQNSKVRDEAGLSRAASERRRFGFRRHYGQEPWSPFVEVHWGPNFQIYVTPVSADQVCLALVSASPHLRLDAALGMTPVLAARVKGAVTVTAERGSVTVSRKLRSVCTDGYVLLGDASGSVDAITGEGMCLAFRQAEALVEALEARDLRLYQQAHHKIGARAHQMAALMLLMDGHASLQRRALTALSSHPDIFSAFLGAHVGHRQLSEIFSWRLLSFGFEMLSA